MRQPALGHGQLWQQRQKACGAPAAVAGDAAVGVGAEEEGLPPVPLRNKAVAAAVAGSRRMLPVRLCLVLLLRVA
jgi:hypothetical protein